ncbi:MAG: ATPase, partial [Moraxellaceae bacterium]|nr:ATPase [Moraxellaceae bacterium]
MTASDSGFCTVRVTRHFHAACCCVYDAFLQPEVARHFLFATPAGRMIVAEVDVRIGGAFTFTDLREDGAVEHTGIYLEIDRPHRLAFTLNVKKYSGDTDRVTLDIMPRGGGCDLTVTHQMHARWGEYAERTRRGWASLLEGLATAIALLPPSVVRPQAMAA